MLSLGWSWIGRLRWLWLRLRPAPSASTVVSALVTPAMEAWTSAASAKASAYPGPTTLPSQLLSGRRTRPCAPRPTRSPALSPPPPP